MEDRSEQRRVWYVLTPAGEAGPYFARRAADDAARPFGWVVVSRWQEFSR